MRNKNETVQMNDKRQYNGYQEWYKNNGELELRGFFKDGDFANGYIEINKSTIFVIK